MILESYGLLEQQPAIQTAGMSELHSVSNGVLQGATTWPILLYVIYIGQLPISGIDSS